MAVANCAGIAQSLVEVELFGCAPGAYTGAQNGHAGLAEAAVGSTLFLNEFQDAGMPVQASLLALAENAPVRRVGSPRAKQLDVRLVLGTNVSLEQLLRERKLREDLYWRLKPWVVPIPALRERIEDLPLLVATLLRELTNSSEPHVSDEAMRALCAHEWPGNVRELKGALASAWESSGNRSPIPLAALPESVRAARLPSLMPYDEVMARASRDCLLAALSLFAGDGRSSARALGMPYSTFRHVARRHGIKPSAFSVSRTVEAPGVPAIQDLIRRGPQDEEALAPAWTNTRAS